MMAPEHMRATQIAAVVDAALRQTNVPIEKLEIDGGLAKVTAGAVTLVMRCHLGQGFDGRGNMLLGSNHWSVETVERRTAIAGAVWRRFKAALCMTPR